MNGGETWERLSGKDRERGLPKTDMDRIGIAVAPSDPNIVYVISETKNEGELWRSDDGGDHWRMVNRDPNINFRPFYYADIRVDPQNPESRVLALRLAVPVGRRRHERSARSRATCTATIRRCGSIRRTRSAS